MSYKQALQIIYEDSRKINSEYKRGYDDGVIKTQLDMKEEAAQKYIEGYDRGKAEAEEIKYQEGHTAGYQEGYEKGESDTETKKYQEGYDVGYEDAYRKSQQDDAITVSTPSKDKVVYLNDLDWFNASDSAGGFIIHESVKDNMGNI
jgi:flagellar biosynthesis/type III secretory pathway protein FliH